jgi:DnaA family protein
VTEQLVLDLAAPEPPSFANFLAGRNAEALSAVRRLVAGQWSETGLYLWGAPGAGKTHLLQSAVTAAREAGREASYVADAGMLIAQDPRSLALQAVVAVDALEHAPADAQARLFTLFNELAARGGHLLAAGREGLANAPLREDLRTRLAWGPTYEVVPLPDADKVVALIAYARGRGFNLADDVIGYLLAHGRRDMPALLGTLKALDRYSLATRRPISVSMLRDWLQRQLLD